MSEGEWWWCQQPQMMLLFLRNNCELSRRKARLFAVACCRRVWHLLVHECSREAVTTGERFADGLVSPEELRRAYQAAEEAWQGLLHAFVVDFFPPDNAFARAITYSGGSTPISTAAKFPHTAMPIRYNKRR
jgi:hypothetical protein